MPYVGRSDESYSESGIAYAGAHVDIFGEHFAESSDPVIYLAGKTHVESSWGELLQLYFSAADAAGCEKRRHGIVDGFLSVGERIVRSVGSAVAVERILFKSACGGLEVVGRNHAVGVEEHEPSSAGPFNTVVAGNGPTFVFLIEVPHVEAACGGIVGHIFARSGRAVFDEYEFEVSGSLPEQTLTEIANF